MFGEGEGDGDDWVESVPVLWERDCYLAVEACLPDVAPLIDDPNDAVAMPALALLASFPRVSSLQPALWALARGSTLVGRRGAALLVLAQHRAEVSEAVQVALDTLEGLDAVYAAAAEVLSRGASSSVFSWAQLLDVSPKLGAQSCAFAGQVSRLVALCLERCTPEVRADAVDQLIELLVHTKGWAKVPLMQAMLRLAFTQPKPHALSELQREVLEELVRDGLGFGSGVELVLRERGLPTTKEGLQTLLEGG